MWRCRNCGESVNIEISYPVYCSCGWMTLRDGTLEKVESDHNNSQEKVMVSDFIQSERISFCKKCSHYTDSISGPTCSKTDEPIDDKILWADSRCPLNRWISLKTQSNGGCGC